ncbi:hypothetical protein ACFFMM_20715 [Micromonospora chaiyaphumensis]|uniref:HEAT repeat-containing protein n=1 Tax=Micromonospora chaiyaphumensis TaxID=307119 RepID=A0A1C4TWG9_9ACTN|nr:hypothetical protein [Micromonospora chaiyaphumensis]SCE63736.1 hypothetical protein GA0070214_10144 [Micromonospora chaiyaphumensis]
MLRDLDGIDWASLTHAYGSAEDVPALIRDLRSSDAEVRGAAMYELYGNIYHQGTRYEASALAVPFLLELVADPTTPARHEVIQLLSCLAVGYSPYHIPAGGFPVGSLRNDLAQVPEETWRRWSQAMRDWYEVVRTGQRQPPPLTRSELRLIERRYALATYDAVRAGVPLLSACLTDADAQVVGEAIHALAWFSEEWASIRPRLLVIASDDQRPASIVGGALIALGLVGGALTQPVADLLDRNLAGPDPDLRWAAAVAWAQLGGAQVPGPAIAELRRWAVDRRPDAAETIWGASPSHVALEVLDAFAAPVAGEVRSDLVAAALAEQPTSNWHNHFNVVLARAFPRMEPDHRRGFAELTAAQRAVVAWLIDNPQVFGPSGPQGPLRQHGLPTTHEALRAYAGQDG